jgi:hypothetical protein
MLRGIRSDPTKRRWVGWAALAGAFILVNFHHVSTAVLVEQRRAFDDDVDSN